MDKENPPKGRIRPMTLEDVEVVHQIDLRSFSTPWPARSYWFEVSQNEAARCWVIESQGDDGQSQIVAMTVLWFIVDEIHLATIAVHPDFRGMGFGKWLLAHALLAASREGARKAFLEVRSGNLTAQKLYRDFGFEVTGIRPHYYRDNMEDALLMTLDPIPVRLLQQIDQMYSK